MTAYHVLKRQDDGSWLPITTTPIESATDRRAVRIATEGKSVQERTGEFLCVAERSFKTVTRRIETQEVDRWDDVAS